MKRIHFQFLVLYILLTIGLVVLFSGVFLSIIVGLITEDFSYELLRVSTINAFIFAVGIAFSLVILSTIFDRLKLYQTIIINILIIFGLLIIDYLYIFLTQTVFFIVYRNVVTLYILINFIFIFSISFVMTIFLMMNRELRLKEQIIEQEKRHLAEAKFELLSERINPHFLFNALNTAVALLGDRDKAEDFLTKLSVLMRDTVSMSSKKYHSVESEFLYVKRYLEIQQIRFEERLTYEIDGTSDILIPVLIIQILVENSIKHALKACGKLNISVSAVSEGNKIIIRIYDSYKALMPEMTGLGHGLFNCKVRVEMSGGVFKIADGGVVITYERDSVIGDA